MMKRKSASSEGKISALPCWKGAISIATLSGGLSNESYLVTDDVGRHVARFGTDYPFHHVYRDREVMSARAAHAAGFAPKVEHVQPGVMISAFVDGRTFEAGDVRKNRDRVAALIRDFHQSMPRHVSGAGFMFWVFHIIRDYARTLRHGNSRTVANLDGYLELAEELERAQVPLPIIFAHNDLLPGNFLDDGDRLWLIDFEYAGFSTAMFDLAGATSNAGMSEDESLEVLTAYFGREPDAVLKRSLSAMQCASLLREAMWSMVSELHLDAPGADYTSYTAENLERLEAALDRYRSAYGKAAS